MPPIRSVTITDTSIVIVDLRGGDRTFLFSQLTAAQDTIAKAENFINLFLSGLTSGFYGAVCHVFTLSPLTLTVALYDVGTTPRPNWWAGFGNG